ncbi:hypothetical protein ANCDUO_12862 [Ancylostoma duodenale]|uniref:Uncharacterized protein n=1 Tax=Ancylostoma duodenale TaxID=51022 RepID=A0A0C2G7M7_9BILA|nr:hypothetical protein ANCDUO_12862 [Ancylostoma duodenale]
MFKAYATDQEPVQAYAIDEQPAHVALFTSKPYLPQSFPKDRKDLKKDSAYDERWFTSFVRHSFARLVVDLHFSAADCITLPGLVEEMVKNIAVVTGAGVQCGSNSNVIHVRKHPQTSTVVPPVVPSAAPPVVSSVAPPVVSSVAPPVVSSVAPPVVSSVASSTA